MTLANAEALEGRVEFIEAIRQAGIGEREVDKEAYAASLEILESASRA